MVGGSQGRHTDSLEESVLGGLELEVFTDWLEVMWEELEVCR